MDNTVREQIIIKTALREFYERKYKLYNANNDLPVTEAEFEALRGKVEELREIKSVLDSYEDPGFPQDE